MFRGGRCSHPNLAQAKQNKQREQRIQQEIVVDAHDAQEQAMGWYYLEEPLRFPFRAKCVGHRAISPLPKGQEVAVVGLAPADECESEMFITVPWEKRTLAVPLAQLEPIQADIATQQAVGDWHYWVEQGYEF